MNVLSNWNPSCCSRLNTSCVCVVPDWNCSKPKMHMITQPMYFVTDDKSVVSKDVLKKLITLDLNDKKENEIKNIASVSHKTKVKSCADTNDIILTYFHGENKYWFYVEKKPFAKGYFKLSYRGTVYKTDITTNSVIGTPIIADGTSVVLKVKHRENASEDSRRRTILKRSGWTKDLRELSKLSQYAKKWNNNSFSDKTYHVSDAFVLKVSNEGKDATGQFTKGEYVLIEPYMPHFEKWNWPMNVEKFAKAFSIQAFGHFTYHCSNGQVLVNDAQGYRDDHKYILTDPYYVDGDTVQCTIWFQNHECNKFCKKTWKRPQGVKEKQLRANFAYGKSKLRRVRPTSFK
eukprot:639291_1